MIPKYKSVVINKCESKFIDEPFVNIAEYSNGLILVDMQYYKQGISGAIATAYARKTIADMLIKAAHNLPEGLHLKILDAWRPINVQEHLFNIFYKKLKKEFAHLTDTELLEKTKQYVSVPNDIYLHGSGGAVDVTMTDDHGNDVNMGTLFDDISDKTHTDYFENRYNIKIIFNRRILYKAMTDAGFVNNPNEWWHYDYGDALWATITNNHIKYRSIKRKDDLNV